MSTFVYYQLYIVLATFYGGIIIGLLYDMYRVVRKKLKINKLVALIQDIVFWVIINIVAISVLLYSNNGILRWYTFLGFIMGIIIYNIFLSTLIEHTLNKIIDSIFKALKAIQKSILEIIGFAYKLIKYPIIKLCIFLKPVKTIINRLINIPKRIQIKIKKYTKTILSKK